MFQFLSISYSDVIETNILLYDDFNDNSLNTEIWDLPDGDRVVEEDGIFKVEEITDKGGRISTKWFDFKSEGIIKIERMVKVNFGNEYYYANMILYIENAPFMSVQYSNYIYEQDGHCKKVGFFINRNSANTHQESDQNDVSDKIDPIWNEWFKETIEYNTESGKFFYYINDEKRMTFDVGVIPNLENYRFRLYFDSLGWWTNHIHYMDNLKITQELSAQDETKNNVFGKIITSPEILGYTAAVAGATVKAIPYGLSSFTDNNGDFQLTNIPVGECILLIESNYFQSITKSILVKPETYNNAGFIEVYNPICQNLCDQEEFDKLSIEYKSISNTYLLLSSNFQTLSSSYIQCKNTIESLSYENDELRVQITSMFTQEDMNEAISQKDRIISQLNSVMASMFSQDELNNAIIEARKGLFTSENVELMINKILEWDVDNDGTIGLEEAIQALMISTGIKPIEQ